MHRQVGRGKATFPVSLPRGGVQRGRRSPGRPTSQTAGSLRRGDRRGGDYRGHGHHRAAQQFRRIPASWVLIFYYRPVVRDGPRNTQHEVGLAAAWLRQNMNVEENIMGNMERKIVLGWGLTLAIVIFVAVYWLNEPQRMAMASEEFRLEAVQRGAELYAEHCASCHGDEGQGIPNVGSPLNSRAFLEMYDDEAIGAAIYDGRPNTLMTAYAQAKGGPLRDNQIEDLVAFIRNWEAMAPLLPTPTPVIDPASLYAQYCAGCHGPNGEGTDAISLPLNSKGFLERTDDATLYRLIAQGRPEQGMPTFAGELSKAEINALVSFVRAWEATAPELAPGGATLYARYCAFCHGANGEGVKNVPVVLNFKEFLSTHDDAYLRQVIAEGHEDMPPWSLTMTEGEIERLVGFIRAWEEMAPEEEGGEALYARHCAFCHGPQGEGAPNVPIVL
ncbi:MAG TPA: c-type cytochrome, partial [Anaerolineae bacterium]|nr:c-type cytochrome [Anaerolineae bacterium]